MLICRTRRTKSSWAEMTLLALGLTRLSGLYSVASISTSVYRFLHPLCFQLIPDYKKLAKAFTYLRENEGCLFLLTNQDPTYPTSFSTDDPEHPIKHALFPGATVRPH